MGKQSTKSTARTPKPGRRAARPSAAPTVTAPAVAAPAVAAPAVIERAADVHDDAASPTYNWVDLAKRIAPPTERDRALYAPRDTVAHLTELGTDLGSERVLTDLLRWCGQIAEFLDRASPEQVAKVVGFSPGYLRVAFAEGQKLRAMLGAKKSHDRGRAVAHTHDADAAGRTHDTAMRRRAQLYTVLLDATRGTPATTDVESAHGTAANPEQLEASLEALTRLAREILARPETTEAQRLTEGHVTRELLAEISALAKEQRTAATRASGSLATGATTGAQLDAQDGVCLTLMRGLMTLFNAAHDDDPTIPRLTPISTRRVFLSHPKHAAAHPAPAAPAAAKS